MEHLDYNIKKEKILKDFSLIRNKGMISLGKNTSNLFRTRSKEKRNSLNLRCFDDIISIDYQARIADIEGMTTYETYVYNCLKHGLVPTVAPELKGITVGGAISGIGIESSSFKYGFVHETVIELDVLTGRGEILTCSSKKNPDLFFAIPNSYGTLGYILRAKLKVISSKKFVKINRTRYSDYESFVEDIKNYSLESRLNETYDYIDGLIIKKNEMYLNLAKFVDIAPFLSDYTYMNIYYKSMGKELDFLKTEDYIFRYDTDLFWTTKSMGLENKLLRFCLGRNNLRSDFFYKILQFENKYGPFKRLNSFIGNRYETLIQDAEVPVQHAPDFLKWFHEKITDRRPLTIGAVIPYRLKASFTLFPMDPNQVYMNIGYYASVPTDKEEGYYNRLFEEKLMSIGAKKMMYSNSLYSENEFWKIIDHATYFKLKQKYDPENVFPDLYEKCVLRK